MINVFLWILFAHFVADFTCQSDKMAINKSSDNYWLTFHVVTYSFVMFIMVLPIFLVYLGFLAALGFSIINGILHWITDYHTSRLNSKLWKEEKRHWFFVAIGFDQFIHALTLGATLQLFFR